MHEPAIAKYSHILEHVSDCDEALLMRGILLGQIGRIDSALADIESAISINKNDDLSFSALAYLYAKKGNEEKAIELCECSLTLNSTNIDAGKLLEYLCRKHGDEMLKNSLFDRAEDYYTKALKYKKDDPSLLYKLVLVARSKGKIKKSIEIAERVVEINPAHVRAKAHIASSYELLGELDKGNRFIDELFSEHPEHPLVNIVYAQYALRNKQQEKGITALLKAVSNDELQDEDLIGMLMLLGSLYDSIEQYDLAFKYFQQANELQKQDYDSSTYKNYISELINYFSRESYLSIPSSENLTDELIFIVGMPRSGTSLVEQIISSHPGVFGAGELTHVHSLVDTMQGTESPGAYPSCLSQISVGDMSVLADRLLSGIKKENSGGKPSVKITDKMPQNFHHIAFLHKLFPNAKFINCVRDAKDTCLSCYFQRFVGYHPYACDLHDLGIHYQEYERLMKHWTEELNIPVHTVKYEDIVSSTRDEVGKMLDFLGLYWDERCMEFYKRKRTATTASYNQVNKKIYNKSVGRWKNYESHLNLLFSALR